MSEIKKGDTLSFGRYPQRDSERYREPIGWKVLDIEADRIFLLSLHVLDCRPFDGDHDPFLWPAAWEECSLRRWLNTDFLEYFTPEERSAILVSEVRADPNPAYESDSGSDTRDRVFCLSMEEVGRYFSSGEEALASPTEYARNKGLVLSVDPPGYCSYWLRTAGYNGRFAAIVAPYKKGEPAFGKGSPYNSRYEGVRPAMWIRKAVSPEIL